MFLCSSLSRRLLPGGLDSDRPLEGPLELGWQLPRPSCSARRLLGSLGLQMLAKLLCCLERYLLVIPLLWAPGWLPDRHRVRRGWTVARRRLEAGLRLRSP